MAIKLTLAKRLEQIESNVREARILLAMGIDAMHAVPHDQFVPPPPQLHAALNHLRSAIHLIDGTEPT